MVKLIQDGISINQKKYGVNMKVSEIITESLKTKNPCWKGYHPVGTKKKGGKTVPNCVPTNEAMVDEDWQSVNKKDKTDGMSKKAVSAYKKEHPGSKLKTAVTTDPSKLKKGSKDSKRRSSFCARSNGQKKMHHIDCSSTPDKPICKARSRWNCE